MSQAYYERKRVAGEGTALYYLSIVSWQEDRGQEWPRATLVCLGEKIFIPLIQKQAHFGVSNSIP